MFFSNLIDDRLDAVPLILPYYLVVNQISKCNLGIMYHLKDFGNQSRV